MNFSGEATLTRFERNGKADEPSKRYLAGIPGASGFWPHTAWFCGECGEIFRREVLTYHFDYRPLQPALWTVRTSTCTRCYEGSLRRQLKQLLEHYQ